jgi:hypothetical protein
MDCKDVQNLLTPLVIGDLDPDSGMYSEVKGHLDHCRVCSQEYEAIEQEISFIKTYKDEFEEALNTFEYNEIAMQQELEHGWQGI